MYLRFLEPPFQQLSSGHSGITKHGIHQLTGYVCYKGSKKPRCNRHNKQLTGPTNGFMLAIVLPNMVGCDIPVISVTVWIYHSHENMPELPAEGAPSDTSIASGPTTILNKPQNQCCTSKSITIANAKNQP